MSQLTKQPLELVTCVRLLYVSMYLVLTNLKALKKLNWILLNCSSSAVSLSVCANSVLSWYFPT